MTKTPVSHFALVLPGAVARGAYEAGVIQVLAESEMHIDRIVATSSGALNGLAYAIGIRNGCEKEMAQNLIAAWIENGGWQNSLSLNPLNLLTGRGLSDNSGLLEIMRRMVKPERNTKKREVEFRVIVAPINGVIGNIGKKEATTYEKIINFTGKDFDTQESLENVFNVVSAACAFPGLFRPVEIKGLGACLDGGTVNNAPIRYALEESDVNRVIIPVPFPRIMALGDWKRGMGLLNHLIAILINERLYRDLKNAQTVNKELDKLTKLMNEGIITKDQLDKIKSVLEIRNVEITEVRPLQNLKCSPFSGFFQKSERIRLIEAGRVAAQNCLERIPAHNIEGIQTT
ncbi:patatin-like phospholipase family protein [Bacteriovorax sp. PP10]|uniref:Patatin-like phospholipase family protein n=1 Tax=Bacteriovorax antarcticus TaxID=3088717 RepID=A0ABU5VX86_9BACT|nr:patatin-like phospholipase family protein [Bacteriovorax sp. PP10]MEA9356250.1 patatin-like phospholipase family protein [Bacteriovorax sp. PP10]